MSNSPIVTVAAIILSHNSESTIQSTIESCLNVTSKVIVVDDYSTDRTRAIAESLDCEFVLHKFDNYSDQRNWAQTYAGLGTADWVLHIDSDEVVSGRLAIEIPQAVSGERADAYLVKKQLFFLGKPIRFGFINPSWHLRLFKVSMGFCEDRLYDQHFVSSGRIGKLKGTLLDYQSISLEQWTASHNRWSTAEALEVIRHGELRNGKPRTLPAKLSGDIRMRKRWLRKNVYYHLPLLIRSFLFFLYSYIVRLGFLDGLTGFIFHFLQTCWYRFLVDAKIMEQRLHNKDEGGNKSTTY